MSDVVLITGVGKRLGYALANHFLAQGVRVVGTFRTDYPELDQLRGMGADLYQVDFYQQPQIDDFISAIKQEYTVIRALIHNASDWLPDSAADNEGYSAAEVLQKMMAIHAGVPYQLNLAFQPQLKASTGQGDIIHISDYVAEKGSKKHIAYAASKAAMNNLTLSFASLLAPGVKVNSISPALVRFNQGDEEDYKQKALAKALIPREAGFAELTEAIDFVLASHYMTGRNLQLDGGRHLK